MFLWRRREINNCHAVQLAVTEAGTAARGLPLVRQLLWGHERPPEAAALLVDPRSALRCKTGNLAVVGAEEGSIRHE